MSKLKAEVSATVAIVAGMLLASGYILTLARLHSKGLPTESILAALPTSYYVGTAIESSWLPLGIALTGGAVWLAAVSTRDNVKMPPKLPWVLVALGISLYAWVIAQFTYQGGFDGAPTDFFVVSAVWAVVVTGVALAVRGLADFLIKRSQDPSKRDRDVVAAAAILFLCVISTIGFRTVAVRYLQNGIVLAIVQENPSACPVELHQEEAPKQGCGENGYYLGESDKWVFLVLQPPLEHCEHGKPPAAARPNELVQIAKSEIHRVILYKESQPQPELACLDP